MASETCCVGIKLGDLCHKNSFTQSRKNKSFKDFTDKEQELICLRSGVALINTICLHREKMFTTRYKSLQRYCCDPLKTHKKVKNRK